jgi:hypothetical protein
MTEKQWKWMFYILAILVLLTCGFFIGRKTVKIPDPKVEIEYVKGDIIRDTVYYPQPYKVVEPIDTLSVIQQCIKDGIYKELWPERVVTEYIEVSKADTTAIMKDWATKRYYTETLFDDETNGKCIFNTEIQYNRMKVMDYEFTPIIKTVTETNYVTKKIEPFIGVAYLTNHWSEVKNTSLQISGGIYINGKYGIQLLYQRGFNLNDDNVGIGLNMKF